jgi:hypothetical protein
VFKTFVSIRKQLRGEASVLPLSAQRVSGPCISSFREVETVLGTSLLNLNRQFPSSKAFGNALGVSHGVVRRLVNELFIANSNKKSINILEKKLMI